ncbi:MAG: hypothetical protein UX14_C0045G0003 [Parcubacteria group bacterium GW2011_GWF1_45_5]|nr:MAG: hypothetical protein UX14_C0045G0003 [Parcubacteria group bacterium GW2011_GWF1_45_5]
MKKKIKKTIVICSSASFYSQVVEVQKQLKDLGFKVRVPLTVNKMVKSNDFKVETYKTWMERPEDYKRKAYLTKKHFNEVEKGDVVLILNYKKNGKDGYIGGAVLSEIAIDFYLKKPIYILNPIDESSSFKEELYGMFPVILNGDLSKIK